MSGFVLSVYPSAAAVAPSLGAPTAAGREPLWARETSLGTVEHRAGQGLRLGDTGFNVGGFTTVEGTKEEGSPGTLEIDGVNLLLLFEPVHFLRVFSEIELGNLFEVDDRGNVMSRPGLEVSRLYGEVSASDHLSFRLGRFLTPIGLWNPVPAEPFVWTTSEPLIAEIAFDEQVDGAMLRGSIFPNSGDLTYSVYGQFFDPLDPDKDPDIEPIDHSVGTHLDYSSDLGNWSTGSSILASERDGDWSYLVGLDAEWYAGPLEITAEVLFSGGALEERRLWGTYAQSVYEAVPNVYLVARYEYFNPATRDPDANVVDLGVAWLPLPYVLLKADYLFVDNQSDVAAPGFRASLSVVF